ncbi:terpene synthase family protein [Streptomyces cinnamoneus]|uniref:terpene synthase family protein n=1 Tax=Streptomyces cinnamoneus TaxID=53446 RepID=UPI00341490E8
MLKLPLLPHPFPYGIHPSFEPDNPDRVRFEEATMAFRDRFHLYGDEQQRERLGRAEIARFAAMMYRSGRDELLQVASDLLLWVFAFDDEYCDEGPLSRDPAGLIQAAARIQRSIESPEHVVNTDRYALALHDIRCRLDRYAVPVQVGRFVEAMRTYLMAEMWKAVTPKPSLNDYLVMRLYGGGGWVFVPVLHHIVAGIDLAQEDYEDRRVRALAEIVLSLAQWDLEPYSYVKERARAVDGKEHNLIAVLCRERGCGVEQALSEYMTLRARALSLFRRLRIQVETEASPAVRSYIQGIVEVYSGNVFWGRANHRYRSVSGLGDECTAYEGGELVDAFPDAHFEPLGLPSFDWWWHYDPARRS